mmetsp:Transcript_80017/g.129694  ORF Transcript_80017/g.129694 Transcript_80017/m.129694 type:complete len:268 (-) Transcript_80017:331-1134(-)
MTHTSCTSDLIAWGCTGARTVDSQVHREMVSGLEMPVGVKHDVYGHVNQAMDSIISASSGHTHLSIGQNGLVSQVTTRGNKYAHLVLRGGGESSTQYTGTNYDTTAITKASIRLGELNLARKVVVDCSHGNSRKTPENQVIAANELIKQIAHRKLTPLHQVFPLAGLMLESNLKMGKQEAPRNADDVRKLAYGVSITDACIGWETTGSHWQEFRGFSRIHPLLQRAAGPQAASCLLSVEFLQRTVSSRTEKQLFPWDALCGPKKLSF